MGQHRRSTGTSRGLHRNHHHRPLRFEPLEERRLLAITVNTLVDEADGSIVDGDISLRDALALAPVGEEINFAPALTAGGPAKILLSHGDLPINKSLSIVGPGAGLLTIDAHGNDSTPNFTGNGSHVFLIDDGVATRSNVSIRDVTITGADHPGFGGAIRSAESLTVRNTIFFHNGGADGGAIATLGPLSVFDTEFYDNHAKSGGGAIQISNAAFAVEITRSVIRDNSATGSGGGIYVAPNRAFATSIVDSLIQNNDAGSSGGGILSSSPLVVSGSSIVGNHADLDGGGIWTAHQNSQLKQVTVSGNEAGATGGAIYSSQPLAIYHSTIANNKAAQLGGGIYSGIVDPLGKISLDHSIVADNQQNGATANDLGPNMAFALHFTLLEVNSTNLTPTSDNVIGVDPKLQALADNGGPTLPGGKHLLTQALSAGSAAINAGNPAAVAGVGSVPLFDERGTPFVRIVGGRIDLGAVESPASSLPSDYNRNGVVDAADYTVWRDTLGTTNDLRADGSGSTGGTPDGVVNQQDYSFWKARFGGAPGDYSHNGVVDAADYTVWRDTLGSTTDLRANGSGAVAGTPDGVVDQHDYDFWKSKYGIALAAGEGSGAGAMAVEMPLARNAMDTSDEPSSPAVEETAVGAASSDVVAPSQRVVGSQPPAPSAVRSGDLLNWLSKRTSHGATDDEVGDSSPNHKTVDSGGACDALDRVFALLGSDG